jgi:hypothetical protein
MHRLPDDPTPSDLAVQRAAALSHAHGHGWASRLTDADRVAIAAHRRESTPEEISLPEWDESADPRLPRTASEAELHSYLEERLGDGRGMFGLLWSPEPDGSVRHTTGTGRVQWHVRRDGRVTISVRRPSPEREDGVECLHAELSVAGDLRITVGPAHAELRHVDVLGLCLGALDCGRTQFRALVWDLCPDQRALPSLTSGETAASYLARVRAERDRWIAEGSKKSTGRE